MVKVPKCIHDASDDIPWLPERFQDGSVIAQGYCIHDRYDVCGADAGMQQKGYGNQSALIFWRGKLGWNGWNGVTWLQRTSENAWEEILCNSCCKTCSFAYQEKINKHTSINNIDNAIMAPKATFPSIIKTCPKNKDVHPGDAINNDDGNPKPKCQTPAEMKEVHHQQELAQQVAKQNSQNAIAAVGSVEDSLCKEDIAWLTCPNHQL